MSSTPAWGLRDGCSVLARLLPRRRRCGTAGRGEPPGGVFTKPLRCAAGTPLAGGELQRFRVLEILSGEGDGADFDGAWIVEPVE
jgi:hypothetical protein